MEQDKHMVVGRTSSSKGKRSANSAPKPGAPPKKKRRVLDSDDDDDDDEPLASKKRSANHHDQSIEGWLAFYYPYSINSTLRYSR
jgi:hypothetical protein